MQTVAEWQASRNAPIVSTKSVPTDTSGFPSVAQWQKSRPQQPVVTATPSAPTVTHSNPIISYLKGIPGQISESFSSSFNQGVQGATEIGGGENPLSAVASALKVGAGVTGVAFSPLAPVTNLIGKAIQFAGNGLAETPLIKDYATTATDTDTKVLEALQNLGTVAMGILGAKAGDIKTGDVTPAKLETLAQHPDVVAATHGLIDAQKKVQDTKATPEAHGNTVERTPTGEVTKITSPTGETVYEAPKAAAELPTVAEAKDQGLLPTESAPPVSVPESTAPGDTGATLSGGLPNPHLDTFIENDLKPTIKSAGTGLSKTWDFAKSVFNPAGRSPEALKTASIMRESLGRMSRSKEVVYSALDKSRKIFDRYSKDESLNFIDNLETGKTNEGADGFTKTMRDALDSRWKAIQAIKGSEAYIENYFPHIWKDPAKAAETLTGFGKRPLEGTKGYMKERTIPTIKEGVAKGLEPSSYNPVDLIMARVADMDRFLMAHEVWTQFKEDGLRKFVRPGESPPDGWKQIDDKIARAFQFSPTEKGMILRGNWYMPEKAADIVNNYLSPGLTNNPIYNAFRMVGNTLNQVQLGLSGYHAFFTSGDAVISKTALELQKLFSSATSVGEKVGSAAKVTASPVVAPYYVWKNLTRGDALLKDYFRDNPQVPALVDALERAGGRVKVDSFYHNNAVDNFMKAVRGDNYVGALLRSPGAMIEMLAKPIMQELVPRQKLGVFADAAAEILRQAQKEGWSEYKTTLRLQEMWDSVDNRMGQLVYDNLFWNKVVKDLGMAGTRSLGWNLGTLREIGGGVIDYGKTIGKLATKEGRTDIHMTPKMAYTVALPYVVGLWGAATYYMFNGTAPTTLLDYYYPKTGKTKPDGTDERVSLPSYMKDVYAWKTEGLQTGVNKLHPEISAIIAMLQNKDYFGTEIRNPSDSLVKQFEDIAAYQAKQYVPFTITNLLQRAKTGGSWAEYLQSFAGVSPAPGYITRTPLQTEIYSLYDKRFGGSTKSQEQTDIAKQKAEVRTLYLQGKTEEANKALETLVTLGIVKDKALFIKEADIPNDVKLFTQLPADDQKALLSKMELYQLNRYAWYAKNDVKAGFSALSPNAKTWVEMEKAGDVKQPVWKKNQDINQEVKTPESSAPQSNAGDVSKVLAEVTGAPEAEAAGLSSDNKEKYRLTDQDVELVKDPKTNKFSVENKTTGQVTQFKDRGQAEAFMAKYGPTSVPVSDATYYVRDNTITEPDLEEAKAVLFGEVSNRTSAKQQLEAQTILNTAFNRMDEYRKRGIEKTLTEVLQMDNQYQAYKGKEYERYKAGDVKDSDSQKTEAIDAILAKVKDGSFQNNIGNSVFYAHKPDGRIVATNKKLFKT